MGYARAVRVGNVVHVSGTTATDEAGNVVAPGDAYAQTAQALRNVRRALEALGARPEDTVRARMYVTDISNLMAHGRSNAEIAQRLVLSRETAANHVSNIFAKLQVADRLGAIIRAREAGLGREEG